MKFEHIRYFGGDHHFHTGAVTVENGMISQVEEYPCQAEENLLPGLIDLHFHGNSGADFSDGDDAGLLAMARFHAAHGVTAFSPATMTLPETELLAACASGARFKASAPAGCARIVGVTMEGPFFSEKKKGAQSAEYLRLPELSLVERLAEQSAGLLKIVCVAPELPGAEDFIRSASQRYVVSIAHTAANYEEAAAGYEAGATHTTHLYNAMPPLAHREPGVIGAAAEREAVTVELICDGVHIHPSVVRLTFRLFGAERICLISDSMRACGMPDGQYTLGGQEVTVRGNRATLADGTIAGSVTPLYTCMRRAIEFGVPEEQAVCAASTTPARVLGLGEQLGVIEAGRRADVLRCSLDYELHQVYLAGQPVLA